MSKRWDRLIEVYDRATERLVTEHNVNHIPIKTLREVFGYNADDPQFLRPRRIDPKHAVQFSEWVSVCFDFDQYEYDYIVRSE